MSESVNPFSFHKTLNYVIYRSYGLVSIFGDLGLCCSKERVVTMIVVDGPTKSLRLFHMFFFFFFGNKQVLL